MSFSLTVRPEMSKYARPAVSMVISITFSGSCVNEVEDGGSASIGSILRNLAVSMKNVTSRKARSTIGVISNEGAVDDDLVPERLLCDFAILIFDIVLLLFSSEY
jgi:hypothetical protein